MFILQKNRRRFSRGPYYFFCKLKQDFLKNYTGTIPNTFDQSKDYRKIFKPCNAQFEKEWQSYHKKNAKLQILCKECNLKRKPPKF